MRWIVCLACLIIGLGLVWRGVGEEARDSAAISWLAKISVADVAEARVAQIQLAHRGAKALGEMEREARTADPKRQERLKTVVALMLLETIAPKQLSAAPNLKALCAPDITQTRMAAKPLFNADGYDSGETGLRPPGAKPPPLSLARQAVKETLAHGGFAVPAALDLCANASPFSRMYGVELLFALQASGQLATLRKLTTDEGAISIFHGDYTSKTTIGKETATRLHNASTLNPDIPGISWKPATEAERYIVAFERMRTKGKLDPLDLVNRLRQQAKTYDAASWDDYWRRALPVLKKAWKQ